MDAEKLETNQGRRKRLGNRKKHLTKKVHEEGGSVEAAKGKIQEREEVLADETTRLDALQKASRR